MHDKEELCEKIKTLYPEIGECGIDVDVDWNKDKKTWIVDLKKDIIEKSPDFDASKPVNREYEVRLYDYYGRPVYWDE